jgi:hypothetical protein
MIARLVSVVVAATLLGRSDGQADGDARAVPAQAMCVTLGAVSPGSAGRLRVTAPKVRAVTAADPSRAELRFVYEGPTETTVALASGKLRRQIGLKLRAEDGCNLLYVMWRLAPQPSLVVQAKHNPGQRLHKQCGTHGYLTLRPSHTALVPAIAPGSAHVLRAELSGSELSVHVDGNLVWRGEAPPDLVPSAGQVGFRTDNVRCELELVAQGPTSPAAGPCTPGDD